MSEDAASAPSADTARFELVRFAAAGCQFGLDARQVRRCLPGSSDAPTLEALLGLSQSGQAPAARQTLVLTQGLQELQLEVDAPVWLDSLACDCIHPLPPLLAACATVTGLRALGLAAGELVLILDLSEFAPRPGSICFPNGLTPTVQASLDAARNCAGPQRA